MIDSVLVAPETFRQMILLSSEQKMEWDDEAKKSTNTPKMAQSGLPVWKLAVAVTPWRGRGETIGVSVASATDPVDDLGIGTFVEFEGLVMGMTKTQRGVSAWFSADSVQVAPVRSSSDNHLAAKG